MKQLITMLILLMCSITMAMEETIPPTPPTTTMVTATLSGDVLTITPNASGSDIQTAVKDFSNKSSVKTVTITAPIVAGEDLYGLFYNYTALTSITGLNNLNTEKVRDMMSMFYGCESLSSLDLSSFNTENVMDMSRMFSGCTGLTSLDLSSFNTENVMDMSRMFSGCESLSSLDLSSFNTEKVTSMSFMFSGCTGLESLDLSKFHTEQVTDMRSMFSGCSSLSSLDLSDFNTKQVTYISSMFSGCSSLESLDLSGFDTEKVEYMGGMFSGCKGLVSLDLSKFHTEQVTDMRSMFSGCSSLSSLDLSDFNTKQVTNMEGMFDGCSSLESLDLSGFDTEQVTNMSNMFYAVRLQTVTLSDSIKADIANRIIIKYGCEWVKDGVIYDAIPLTLDNAYAVAGTYTVKKIATMVTATLNDSVLTISPSTSSSTDLKKAVSNAVGDDKSSVTKVIITDNIVAGENLSQLFYNYTNLKSIEGLDKLNTKNVTNMSYMFNRCESLSSLDLSDFHTEQVTDMSFMFSGCTGLESLDLSKFHTEQVTDMRSMFSGCSSLSSLDLSDFNTKQVTYISSMFYNYTNLKSIEGLDKLNTKKVTNMSYMFNRCESLSSLDLSDFHTEQVTDMSFMFSGCTGLDSLDLSNFDTKQVEYMNGMFANVSLQSITLSAKIKANIANLIKPANGNGYDGTWLSTGTELLPTENELTVAGTYKATPTTTMVTATLNGTELTISPDASSTKDIESAVSTVSNKSSVTKVTITAPIVAGESLSELFYEYSALKTIEGLNKLNTEKVTDMYSMFSGCTGLESLDLSSFDTKNVKYMDSMFEGCTGLDSLNLSSFDTEKVESMSRMFYNCTGLASLNLSNFDTKQVTDMMSMFCGCTGLESLNLSNFDTKQVTNMVAMFSGCTGLDSLNLSNFDTKQVTNMNWMFYGVILQSITLSGSIKANIASQILLNDDYEWVKDETLYTAIPTADGLAVAGTYTIQAYATMVTATLSSDGNTLTITPDANSGNSIKVAVAVVGNKSSVKTITITSNIVASRDLDLLFSDYTGLESITGLDKLNTEKVTSMNGMFYGCTSLENLNLSSFDTKQVTDMGWMFYDCTSLASLNLSSFDTKNVEYMSWMFANVTLQSITLSNSIKAGIASQIKPANGNGYDGTWLSTGTNALPMANDLTVAGTYKAKCISYTITYNLDGGTNASTNPATYTVEDTITLSGASKTNYDFKGWYAEDTYEKQLTGIAKGTTGNKDLYAKWEMTLAYTKELKKDSIDALNTYKEDDYRPTQWTELQAIFTTAKAEVDALTTNAEVNAYDITGLTALADAIKTDAQLTAEELAQAKTTAKATLATYANASDYRTAEQTTLATAITNGNTAIDDATDTTAVTQALADAKATIDAIKTNAELTAEELVIAKTTAKDTLATYAKAEDYRTAEKATLEGAIANGNTAIDDATTIAEVTQALADAKATIDDIKTNSELTAEELAQAKTTAKADLATYADADDYRTAEQTTLVTAITNGNTAIDDATNIASVTQALADAKTTIDAIKTDAQLTAEEMAVVYTIIYTDHDTITYTKASETITCPTLTKEPTTANGKTTTYTFIGWLNGADTITTIPSGSTGNKTLTAKWTETVTNVVYTVIAGTDTITYTVDDAVTLPTPTKASDSTVSTDTTTIKNYVFTGWLTTDGDTITTIEVGTTGNITLTATWQTETVVGLIDEVKEENYNSDVLVVGPMPINNKSKVFYTVEDAGVYTLELYNISEKLMAKTTVEANDGRNITTWSTLQMLPKGVYYIALKQDGKFLSLRRIVK